MQQTDQTVREKALKILRDARALLDDPDHWVKSNYAVTEMGSCDAWDPKACAFCALGAVRKVSPTASDRLTRHLLIEAENLLALRTLADAMGGNPAREDSLIEDACIVADFNDHHKRKHGEVLVAFDEAIKALERPAAGSV